MSKAILAFVEWVWQTFGILIRINAETYKFNAASGKDLERAGFRCEGGRPDAVVKNGVISATLM
ncbi:hypothetical protein BAUCODRAFT_140516 [Baudoinia panamericana UAMH 10762]|uniref:Uncharacterized protein n=1 Tax=Baudoinia panamericana (strain UAMH 10762) TaxID=717646 RepID=M2N8C4_BAUPA|nr:uncharacterized protein BAUCODRAFT_140516 [Baudoinia panamericana UAMH 10762]EMC95349.1 hypothetical protein BAUCODRAFT_140516 [Baudoinia panamericana UAMH 10762]